DHLIAKQTAIRRSHTVNEYEGVGTRTLCHPLFKLAHGSCEDDAVCPVKSPVVNLFRRNVTDSPGQSSALDCGCAFLPPGWAQPLTVGDTLQPNGLREHHGRSNKGTRQGSPPCLIDAYNVLNRRSAA